ncbi:FecR family protein [Spirosoma daeguense]
MTSSDYKSLLFAHFDNKTTPLQRRMIDEWLKDEANQDRYYIWLVEWEKQLPIYEPEVEKPLARFEAYMNANTANEFHTVQPTEMSTRRVTRPYWWMMAAAVFLVLTIGGWMSRNWLMYRIYQTAYGETKTIRLTDGSVVTLNAHSTLRVPRFGFGVRSREVNLAGEAFFAVQHRADAQKFVVQTASGFNVVVHGTEFNVSARINRAKVVLHKGRIQMDYLVGNTRKQLMLKPGDLVTMNRQNRPQLHHQVWTQPHLAWKEHRIIFDNMPLSEFGQLVADTYGVRVEIASDSLARRTLVGSLQAASANELLQTVSELFDLTVIQQADKVILKDRD